jgi:hypothetical protein
MRHTARVLLVLLAVAYCPAAMAAEQSGLRLWPFRGDRTDNSELTGNSLAPKAPATATAGPSATMPSQPPTTRYTDELPEQHWMLNSPLARVSWPRIHMPEVSLPKPKIPRPQIWPRKSQVDDARNAWVQKSPDPARRADSGRCAKRLRSASRRARPESDALATYAGHATGTEARLTDGQRIHRPRAA